MNMNKKISLFIFFFAIFFPIINVNAAPKDISATCKCEVKNGVLNCSNTNCTASLITKELQKKCGETGTLDTITYTCSTKVNKTSVEKQGTSPDDACGQIVAIYGNALVGSSIYTDVAGLNVKAKTTCTGGATQHVGDNFCADDNVQSTLRFVGYLLIFTKVLVPLAIIFMGTLDLFKAITSGKDDELKTQGTTLGKRIIAGLVIFFIPTALSMLFSMISQWSEFAAEYEICATCLLSPTECTSGYSVPGTNFTPEWTSHTKTAAINERIYLASNPDWCSFSLSTDNNLKVSGATLNTAGQTKCYFVASATGTYTVYTKLGDTKDRYLITVK